MAKKVGILFGMEDTFPWAFIDKVNEMGKGEVIAEPVMIDKAVDTCVQFKIMILGILPI